MPVLENFLIEGIKRRKNRKGEIISFVDADSSLSQVLLPTEKSKLKVLQKQ